MGGRETVATTKAGSGRRASSPAAGEARSARGFADSLAPINEAALAHLHFDSLVEELLRRVCELLKVDTAVVMLLDEASEELVPRAAKGIEGGVERAPRIPVGRGFAGRIAAMRAPVRVPDIDQTEILNPVLREAGVRSLLGVPLLVEGVATGVLHVGSRTHREFTSEEADLLQLVADRIAVAIDHARLFDAEEAARAEAEAALEHLRRLEAITEAAFAHIASVDLPRELLVRLTGLLGTSVAVVALLDDDGRTLRLEASVGLDGTGIPPDHSMRVGEGFIGRVAEERRPVMIEDVSLTDVASAAIDASGVRGLVGVPLIVEGRLSGVVTLGVDAPRRFSPAEVDLLERAADRIGTAIDRARLFAAERDARAEAERANERLRQVESLTAVALAHLPLDDELLRRLLARVTEILAVDSAAILLLDDAQEALVPRAASGIAAGADAEVRIPLGEGFAGTIARTGEPLAVEDLDDFELVSKRLRERGLRSLLGVPLRIGDRVAGVLHVGAREPRRFSRDALSLLQLAGERISIVIGQARLYEREHRVAEALQRSMLPDRLPALPELPLGASYRAGAAEADVGGDWYDAIALQDGSVALVLGDVVSRGLRAATAMGQIRSAARAYILDGTAPAQVLSRLEPVMRALPDREMATVVVAVVDPATLSLRFATAGHPPPLVISAGGSTELLEGGRSAPLGTVSDPVHREWSGTLEHGSTILLYTDGIVEGRDMWIGTGLDRLASSAARISASVRDPQELCDRLVDELVSESTGDDDVALLAARVSPQPRDKLVLELAADPTVLAEMRRRLRHWLATAGASEAEIYDILVAASEAGANAVEHAYGPADASFEVEARAKAGEVIIEVRDHGSWRAPRGRNRGRGTMLMSALTDALDVSSGKAGTVVTLRRRLAGAGREVGR